MSEGDGGESFEWGTKIFLMFPLCTPARGAAQGCDMLASVLLMNLEAALTI